ncbi:steroidogenic acute regulatory protein-like [Limulus polyphemus]|uniref:Steroidogenic acute regulatory protein-like n=1 Tax=Limulus polyphemus TaxID=6850 RepID=A0ABM1SN95_LIMPO|nr:steroidogenic acute regulatory protein-like [Limulus polyphemus]
MSLSQSVRSISYYGSINSAVESDIIDNNTLQEGSSFGDHISPVRRFFLLLTTFDFVFNVLLWLICTMLTGESVQNAFKKEVIHYSFESSLFDIVVASSWRFIFILLAYGLFRISHWWMIALTTTATGIFVICKVFFYQWNAPYEDQTPYTIVVVLLIASFVMSWAEAWFLDFRVVPTEEKASLLLAKCVNDRTPFIPPYESESHAFSEDGTFYSPLGSTIGDVEDDVEEHESDCPPGVEYKIKVDEAMEEALEIISTGSWKTEKLVNEDIVQSREVSKYGKVFKFVHHHYYYRGEHGPSVYVFSPVDGSTCHLQWLVNTDLKGWLPQYLIDQTMASLMFNYVKHLRAYVRNGTNNSDE